MKKLLIILACVVFTTGASAQNEVIYHVFQRSFFDSNGDGHGDLNGIKAKLNYLQQLGVTSLLLTPLYQSGFYHNYFADDFEKIDPTYGTMEDYRLLVKEVHKRGMKIYQDVEMQYVTGKHEWFAGSYKKPSAKYGNYLYYHDRQNLKPYYFYDVPEFTTYNNSKEQIIVVNMNEPKVKEYTAKMLKYWIDPNGDGKFDDGVDGYRLDHMMDNLDNSGKLTNLFQNFWAPLLAELKTVRPDLTIIAEQADWNSYGYDYLTKGNTDRVFAFRLKQAIATFDRDKIAAAADSTFLHLPEGKQQVVFIENHDTKRFASEAGINPAKLKAAAALNVLIGGIPSIYYGQEIGMKGEQLKGKTDGNDIPVREAFEWYAGETGEGMALWYKGTGPWWDNRNMKPGDGISFEEQQKDPESLYNFYRSLLRIKKQPALAEGSYRKIDNTSFNVFSFVRESGNEKVLVVINLSDYAESAMIDDHSLMLMKSKLLLGSPVDNFKQGGKMMELPPYAVQVWRL